jgi:hypothetical protein
MLVYNIIVFTLVETLEALKGNISISSRQLQVDPGLVGNLLSGSKELCDAPQQSKKSDSEISVKIHSSDTLNMVANDVEQQYFLALFHRCNRDFSCMAALLLGDASKSRAVRLRFNQLGLKVRKIERA